MLKRFCVCITMAFFVCFSGCETSTNSAEQSSDPVGSSDAHDVPQIKPGFFEVGPEYDRVSAILAKSNANIRLDVHQGIEWYDGEKKTWIELKKIEDVKPLLENIETKKLITVSTGKAMWDKSDEYNAKIVQYGEELGFGMTVVTDDTGQGLSVSRVVRHKN